MIHTIEQGHEPSRFTWDGDLLQRKGRLVVRRDEELWKSILSIFHDTPMGGHPDSIAKMQYHDTPLLEGA